MNKILIILTSAFFVFFILIQIDNFSNTIMSIFTNFDGLQQYLTLDMGEAVPTVFTSTLEYLAHNLEIDYDDGNATFTASTSVEADMGTL